MSASLFCGCVLWVYSSSTDLFLGPLYFVGGCYGCASNFREARTLCITSFNIINDNKKAQCLPHVAKYSNFVCCCCNMKYDCEQNI